MGETSKIISRNKNGIKNNIPPKVRTGNTCKKCQVRLFYCTAKEVDKNTFDYNLLFNVWIHKVTDESVSIVATGDQPICQNCIE